jgi:energy-coupling factor transporter ATP-binding protein EcfA2
MYIRKIEIENVRGFEKVELDLDRGAGTYAGWTVIAGQNGTGKSTLLKAIALAVAGPTWARTLQENFAGWIRSGATKAEMKVWLRGGDRDQPRSDNFWAGLKLNGQAPQSEPSVSVAEVVKDWPENLSRAEGGPWSDNPTGWFLAGYGPFRRIGSRENPNRTSAQRVAGLATMFDEDAALSEGIQWLKHGVYAARLDRLERARKLRKDDPTADTKGLEEEADGFDRLHEAVLSLLDDGLLPRGAKVVDFNMDGLWVEQAGVTLPLNQLSDGYRAAAALVFDILRQIHLCYHELRYTIHPSPVRVPYEGVVLIDEIDAHLHIEWQKRIGFWLKEHFPFIQFIVTTHSPFICQAADPKGLIRLPTPGTGERAAHVSDEDFKTIVNGGADDAAFTALFGIEHTHSDLAEERKMRVARLEAKIIRGTSTPEERAELEQLLAELPDTGAAMVERVTRKHEALR